MIVARIDDFRAELTGGGARASQFRVILQFPEWVNYGDSVYKGEFLINATALPASTISPIEVPYRGRITKVAGERQFANWNVTILNDNDFLIRTALEQWSAGILNHTATNGRLRSLDYQTDMTVQQLDRNENVIKSYKMHNCYPQNISEIALSFANTNSIEEYQVEFSIDYWTTVGLV